MKKAENQKNYPWLGDRQTVVFWTRKKVAISLENVHNGRRTSLWAHTNSNAQEAFFNCLSSSKYGFLPIPSLAPGRVVRSCWSIVRQIFMEFVLINKFRVESFQFNKMSSHQERASSHSLIVWTKYSKQSLRKLFQNNALSKCMTQNRIRVN